MSLEEIIRQYRESENLSMQEFADRCGLSKGYISMLEKGQHPQNNRPLVPSLNTLRDLANGMNMSIDALLSSMDGDALVSINNPAPVHYEFDLDSDEQQLLQDFRSMNLQGQAAALASVHGLAENPLFKKGDSPTPGAMDA